LVHYTMSMLVLLTHLKEGSEMAPLGDDLRTTQVDVDGVHVHVGLQGQTDGLGQHGRVVGAELDDERSVAGGRLQTFSTVLQGQPA
jgi:hypothetical protein